MPTNERMQAEVLRALLSDPDGWTLEEAEFHAPGTRPIRGYWLTVDRKIAIDGVHARALGGQGEH